MSKKTVTTSSQQAKQSETQQFDPQSMAAYHGFLPQYQKVLGEYMQNPLMASYFQNQVGMANKRIGQAGQSGVTQMMQNANQLGVGGPAMASMLAQHQRGLSGQRGDAFGQLLMGAQQNRQWATGAAMGFNPLTTGMTGESSGTGTKTEKTSGLGTWLPQTIGSGLGFASSFMGKRNDEGGGYVDAEGRTSGESAFGLFNPTRNPGGSLPTMYRNSNPGMLSDFGAMGGGVGTLPMSHRANPWLR